MALSHQDLNCLLFVNFIKFPVYVQLIDLNLTSAYIRCDMCKWCLKLFNYVFKNILACNTYKTELLKSNVVLAPFTACHCVEMIRIDWMNNQDTSWHNFMKDRGGRKRTDGRMEQWLRHTYHELEPLKTRLSPPCVFLTNSIWTCALAIADLHVSFNNHRMNACGASWRSDVWYFVNRTYADIRTVHVVRKIYWLVHGPTCPRMWTELSNRN